MLLASVIPQRTGKNNEGELSVQFLNANKELKDFSAQALWNTLSWACGSAYSVRLSFLANGLRRPTNCGSRASPFFVTRSNDEFVHELSPPGSHTMSL